MSQQTLAGYWQHTVGLLSTTDFSYGARIQNTSLRARDRYDATAPFAFDAQAFPLDGSETNYALHAGLEHRFNNVFSVFGRAAHAFRTPPSTMRSTPFKIVLVKPAVALAPCWLP